MKKFKIMRLNELLALQCAIEDMKKEFYTSEESDITLEDNFQDY